MMRYMLNEWVTLVASALLGYLVYYFGSIGNHFGMALTTYIIARWNYERGLFDSYKNYMR